MIQYDSDSRFWYVEPPKEEQNLDDTFDIEMEDSKFISAADIGNEEDELMRAIHLSLQDQKNAEKEVSLDVQMEI